MSDDLIKRSGIGLQAKQGGEGMSVQRIIELPKCRYCGLTWYPAEGQVASSGYCSNCSSARREIALQAFGPSAFDHSDIVDGYVLPRRKQGER